ncbi:MAG: type IV toxin-antitoxin system AbiEi family antitoxin domain-containing protein [Candidatus Dormibacteria bacterium]
MSTTDSDNSAVRMAPGIGGSGREALVDLHRAFPGPFSVADAAAALAVPVSDAQRLLPYLARKRWLTRISRGLYLAVPLDAAMPGEWSADPWLVAAKAFAPCYIGGWSAAEHWSLTEQLFRDVLVVTSRPVRARRHVLQDMPFTVTRRRRELLEFGLRPVWRGATKVYVSDASRTVVDLLDDPSIGGGMRHIANVLAEYLASEHRDDDLFIAYGDRIGNRSVFKRLGWVLEARGETGRLLDACRDRRSAGIVKLDPTVSDQGRIARRWRLRVNVDLGRGDDW